MPVDVAMEQPWASIIGQESEGHITAIDADHLQFQLVTFLRDRLNGDTYIPSRWVDIVWRNLVR